MTEWIKNTGVKPYTGVSNFEVKLRDDEIINSSAALFGDFDWSLDGNEGDIIEWRFTEVTTKQHNTSDEIVRSTGLSQGEVQQILHFLRESLSTTTIDKNYYKRLAKNLWLRCDKDDASTKNTFNFFSHVNSNYKQYKQKEKNLVNLITILKGLQ